MRGTNTEAEAFRYVSQTRIDQSVMFGDQAIECLPMHTFRFVAGPVQNTWLPTEAVADFIRSPGGAVHYALALGWISQLIAMTAGKDATTV